MKAEYLEQSIDGIPFVSAWFDAAPEFIGNGETKEQALEDLHDRVQSEADDLRARYREALHTTGPGEGLPDHLIDQAKKFEALVKESRMEAEGITEEDLFIPYGERP